MTSSWIWFLSLSLSLDEQGRKGAIYCIYLFICLFIWLTARKSIPSLPSWQGFREQEDAWERTLLNGCTQLPDSLLARKNSFPALGFHIALLKGTEPGMLSLGLILSKIAPIPVLRRYGMAVESPALAAFSKMYGSSDFHIPCSTFCLLHIFFSSLWSKKDRASSFIPLLGFRPWRIYDHRVMIIQNLIQSQKPLFLSALFKK